MYLEKLNVMIACSVVVLLIVSDVSTTTTKNKTTKHAIMTFKYEMHAVVVAIIHPQT